jgi:hypothetical protein
MVVGFVLLDLATAPLPVNGGVKTGHGAEQKSATVAPARDRREGVARAGVSGRRGDFLRGV